MLLCYISSNQNTFERVVCGRTSIADTRTVLLLAYLRAGEMVTCHYIGTLKAILLIPSL
jgi:hypothetical protein